MKSVRSIERTLRVLETFSLEEPEFRLAELSRRLGLNKSTVFRILEILEKHHYVTRDLASRKYRLGFGIVERAHLVVDSGLLLSGAVESMVRLRDKLGETVSLHIRVGSERLCIKEVESLHELRLALGVGRRCPLYAGATGRVLLTGIPEPMLADFLSRLDVRAVAPKTIIDRDVLMSAVAETRTVGFAISVEERVAGGASVAAPVCNSDGRTVAALTVLGPVARLTDTWLRAHAGLVRQTALEISSNLGFEVRQSA